MKNLYEFYNTITLRFKDSILFDNEISYRDAFDLAVSRGAFLKEQGCKEGDVIGICAINSREWVMTYMAITMIGCVALPLDNNLSANSYPAMLDVVKAKMVFCSDDTIDKFDKKMACAISFDRNRGDAKHFIPGEVIKDFPASYCFTSGTTGNAKIVVLTHENIFQTAISGSTYLGLVPEDHFLCLLPLFHVYAFVANFTGPFAQGCSLVFLQSLKGPDIIKALRENEFTVFPAAPQLWEMFMDSILKRARNSSRLKYSILMFFLKTAPFFKAIGLGILPRLIFKQVKNVFGQSMKFFISGGAPLKRKYFQYYKRMGLPILEGYGLTETTGPICISHPRKNKPGSVGPAIPGNEILIKNINSDKIGEIWLKGASVMNTYYQNPAMTAEVFDKDCFFNTGDLGRVDRDGYLFITGRMKNVIVLDSGKNVYPEEIESYYKLSSEIAEISVFGRKVRNRETVYAVIVPEQKSSGSYTVIKDEIRRLSKGLPTYKTINAFALSFVPLPVNSARKIVVREVERLLEEGAFMTAPDDTFDYRVPLQAQSKREELVISFLKEKLHVDTLYSHESLLDYGIDSLGTVELIVDLEERLSISIDLDRTKDLHTMEELVVYIGSLEKSEKESSDATVLSGKITTRARSFYNPFIELCALILRYLVYRRWNMQISNPEMLDIENSILVANHQSNLDFLLLFATLPYKKRKDLFVLGKKELFFLRFIFPGSNVLYIERGGNVVATLKASADLLRKGKSLFVFPEGTRSNDGSMLEFKGGAAYLAKNLNKHLLPIAIKGTGTILPKGKALPLLKSAGTITLTVGDRIDPAQFRSVEQLNQHLYYTVKQLYNREHESR